jgi:hypothetical protein
MTQAPAAIFKIPTESPQLARVGSVVSAGPRESRGQSAWLRAGLPA